MSSDHANRSRNFTNLWKSMTILAVIAALGGVAWTWMTAQQLATSSDETATLRQDHEQAQKNLRTAQKNAELNLEAQRTEMQNTDRHLSKQIQDRAADLENRANIALRALAAAAEALKEQVEKIANQQDSLVSILAVQQTRELKNASALVRQDAAEALRLLGPRGRAGIIALERALKDPDAGVRTRVAAAIKAIGPVPPLDSLILRLRDPDEPVEARRTAARDLAKRFWYEPDALKVLKEAPTDGPLQADIEQAIKTIGECRIVLEGHPGPVASLDFSHNGKLLATGCGIKDPKQIDFDAAGEVHLWEADSGKKLRVLKGLPGRVSALDFSPDGKLLAVGCTIEMVKDKQWLGPVGYEVQLWDPNTGTKMKTLKAPKGLLRIGVLAFSSDGRFLAWGGAGNSLSVWDVTKNELVATFQAPDAVDEKGRGERLEWVLSLAFSPDGKTLAATGVFGLVSSDGVQTVEPRSGHTLLWDVAKKELRATIRHDQTCAPRLVFLDGGKTIATARYGPGIGFYEVATAKKLREKEMACTLLTPDGATSAAVDYQYDSKNEKLLGTEIILQALATGKTLVTLPVAPFHLGAAEFSQNGKSLAVGFAETVHLWHLSSVLESAGK